MKREIKNPVSLHWCVWFLFTSVKNCLFSLLLKAKVCKNALCWKELQGKRQEKVKSRRWSERSFSAEMHKSNFSLLCAFTLLFGKASSGCKESSGVNLWALPGSALPALLKECDQMLCNQEGPTTPNTPKVGAHLLCSSRAWGICTLIMFIVWWWFPRREGSWDSGAGTSRNKVCSTECRNAGSAADDSEWGQDR